MTLGIFQKNIKYIFLMVLSLVVFGATIFFGRNAAQFLTRAGSCPVKNARSETVGPNSGTIVWDTDDNSQGRVEYGTNAQSLSFSSPEASASTKHKVPLTLLTPNTIYYYLISVGETKCDSTGQKCDDNCVPYSFTTAPLTPVTDEEVTLTPSAKQNTPTPQRGASPSGRAQPTSSLSLFCKAVEANIGKNKQVSDWATLKTYDIDGNGIINGLDVVKCQKSGK